MIRQNSLHELIERNVELAAPRASGNGIALNCHIDSGCKRIFNFDDWYITQIINNLLSNALKYTEQGSVTVTARCTAAGSELDTYHYEIAITDTGPGIDTDIRRVMFALPEQRESMPQHPEVGVGLVIAKQLCDMINAILTVQPAATGGTVAVVAGTINTAVHDTRNSSPVSDALRNTQALIVDTDMAARRLLEAHLRSWDIDVHSVLDVESAIEHAQAAAQKNQSISMVLVSHDRSEAEIERLLKSMDACPQHADTLLVILGSNPTNSGVTRVASEGTDSITLSKPVRPSELYNCISQHPHIVSRIRSDNVAPQSANDATDAEQSHVLLVEDNVVNQCVAAEILKRIGAHVTIASNGLEAIKCLQTETFDFVFMDCQMPQMDGFEATRKIRSELKIKTLPIVALTANALAGDRQLCMEAGMSDYLTKPFTRDQIAAMLDKWIGTQSETDTRPDLDIGVEDSTLIDADALEQIRQLDTDGQTTIFDEIINEYLSSSRTLIKQIDDATLAANPEGVARVSHALKSSSAAVGLTRFAKQCADLERLGIRGDVEAITELWQSAQPVYKRSVMLLANQQTARVA
ncbi:MAG: response regulator [Pseudomonadota bacterium]